MDELLYDKIRDDALDYEREQETDYGPTAREEALADIERETMNRVITEW
jgi:hypothetical protein